ncbi:hypothetical protein [Pedobacter sp.]|uniref:hypothetical protein n=1 Tax=Pedobacter sp. TaxID=1411316 RepID=UPI003D7FA965
MFSNYHNFDFDLQGKHVKGFCMRIPDDFHETYAVIMDGCHSFCIWLDGNSTWKTSKYTNVEPGVLERILNSLNMSKTT